ncbi:MAG: hypothetical protein ACI80V_001263 [Rhodothermales bacterium]|jgi:hypothetical protein
MEPGAKAALFLADPPHVNPGSLAGKTLPLPEVLSISVYPITHTQPIIREEWTRTLSVL